MYDRAPRLLKLAEGGSTEAHVGPGSYQVPFLKQQATGSYAPFLSLTARESTFTIASSIEKAVPGPGHYNVSEAQKISRSPTLTRSVDIPSIPSCGKSYGYHINDDGSIIKCFPPASDSTLGPAYYKPQFGVSNATLKYKGIHFGNSSGRQELPKKSGPGPGQYDIVQKKTSYYENVNVKRDQQQNYCSFIPRLYEIIVLQEKKKRFLPMKSITPAPGTYNEPRTALKSLKKTSGLKNIPFGQSAVRFTQDIRTEEMPGPGFYNILNNTIIASVRNICSKKQKKSAFGSSVPRTFFWVQKEACATPGPADYQAFWHSQGGGISDELPNLTNKYAAFLSRAERTMKVPDMVIPAPGSYDVHKSYEMSQVKHKYMPPRSLVAKRKHASFLSATPRCLEKMTDGPGPAAYNPVLRKSCPIPLFVKASKRFEESKEITPGPATYELSPFLRHTVLKRTFNVTLPNSFLIDREITPTLEQKAKQKHQGGKI
ncbi:sperm-tail PG-rich repeat-containing protein 2 isoform X3 [Pongo pygmaeus]|uniref:sperm-tail PG-rich repeat-containing protein 2 isoform X3 n=1 Tax=Pongo pygmaeus TaxID=9600 RepID=UPI0023E2DD57|nr:sperm-tail PG-rich repeat-containing protein 2 isoform X3 [Pongo pygmaeus]XP_054410181.1 sperm-tail PG-rich repeat-containing protein 2 isoform X6 [Pongo abelii]